MNYYDPDSLRLLSRIQHIREADAERLAHELRAHEFGDTAHGRPRLPLTVRLALGVGHRIHPRHLET
jgi:hypothetical protein